MTLSCVTSPPPQTSTGVNSVLSMRVVTLSIMSQASLGPPIMSALYLPLICGTSVMYAWYCTLVGVAM